ncbi:MAG: winged helix-turn-helix transcriptional regulator [Solirubrobacteraceae bacterium]
MNAAENSTHPGCCPHYHSAVELIGRRWSGAIVAVLLAEGPQRFSVLRARVPGVSDRVLSQRMKELEGEGLVARTVHPGPPLRVEYALTDKGLALRPAVEALARWGRRWMDDADGLDQVADPTSVAGAAADGVRATRPLDTVDGSSG